MCVLKGVKKKLELQVVLKTRNKDINYFKNRQTKKKNFTCMHVSERARLIHIITLYKYITSF